MSIESDSSVLLPARERGYRKPQPICTTVVMNNISVIDDEGPMSGYQGENSTEISSGSIKICLLKVLILSY